MIVEVSVVPKSGKFRILEKDGIIKVHLRSLLKITRLILNWLRNLRKYSANR